MACEPGPKAAVDPVGFVELEEADGCDGGEIIKRALGVMDDTSTIWSSGGKHHESLFFYHHT